MRKFSSEKVTAPKGATLFQRPSSIPDDCPIDLEIGCGVGWHSISYSQKHPERFLIAIERTSEKFKRFQRRYQHHCAIYNLLPVHADSVPWVVHCLPDGLLSRIFILYPNPYPKNPAARFFRMPFFEELLKKGKEELTIHLATNEKFYRNEAIKIASEHWPLVLESQRTLTRENFPNPRTHFEKKYLLRGEICYDLVFRKVKS